MKATRKKTIVSKSINSTTLEDVKISNFVKSMYSGIKIPLYVDCRTEYHNHLSEKYK